MDHFLTGRAGRDYDEAIAALRKQQPFRKWLTGSGKFTGTELEQLPDGAIRSRQRESATQLKQTRVPNGAKDSAAASQGQVSQVWVLGLG